MHMHTRKRAALARLGLPMRPALKLCILLPCAAAAASNSELIATLLTGYDRQLRPSAWLSGGESAAPEHVDVQMYVEALSFVEQTEQAYGLNGYLRLWWHDPRLQFNRSEALVFSGADKITGSIWLPDIYFEHAVAVHLAAKEPDGWSLTIHPDGKIWWSRQARLQLRCCMMFHRLPFDVQRCPMRMGAYAYSTSQMVLHWKRNSTALVNVVNQHAETWNVTDILQKDKVAEEYSTGSYSALEVFVELTRESSSYNIYLAIPIVMVSLSYLGFWVNPAATPARVALGIISILTVVTNMHSLRKETPPLPYNTWIDLLVFTCLAFNLMAFIEQVAVNVGLKAQAAYDADAADGVIDGLVGGEESPGAATTRASIRRSLPDVEEPDDEARMAHHLAERNVATAMLRNSYRSVEQGCAPTSRMGVSMGQGLAAAARSTGQGFVTAARSTGHGFVTPARVEPTTNNAEAAPLPPINGGQWRVAPAPPADPPPSPPSASRAPSTGASSSKKRLSFKLSSITWKDRDSHAEIAYQLTTCSGLRLYYKLRCPPRQSNQDLTAHSHCNLTALAALFHRRPARSRLCLPLALPAALPHHD